MTDPTHYAYRVFWSDEDSEYVGLCAEFPGLSFLEDRPDKALNGIIEVVGHAIEILQEDGKPLPEPLNSRQYSGRFHVRVTPEIHRNLVIEAAEQGVSLNRHVSAKLA